MYRYICIDFGYLSVIVSSTGLNLFMTLSWTGVNLYPFPDHREREHTSFRFLFLPFVSPHHHLSSSSPACVLLSRPFTQCHREAFGQALLWGHDTASGPEYFSSQTRTGDLSHFCSLTAANWTCLAPLNYKMDQNSSELGPFLTCSMEL